jgi:hypothetical protein
MERGLLAPLSPNELTALRRVANGITKPKHLRSSSVERLKRLALVEESDGRIRLTALDTSVARPRCRPLLLTRLLPERTACGTDAGSLDHFPPHSAGGRRCPG